jgi:alpha-1,3/alpha-1,6-mannosyltransferase
MAKSKFKVSFLHLDLGIGGAERLVVDSAFQLKKMGYEVKILTSHHDNKHSFMETNITGKEGLKDNIEVIDLV